MNNAQGKLAQHRMNDIDINIVIAGENALIIYFLAPPSPKLSEQIQQVSLLVRQNLCSVLIDLVPSYASLLVLFDLHHTDYFHVLAQLNVCINKMNSAQTGSNQLTEEGSKLVELPAYYGVEVGIDLAVVAEKAQLSIEEVIAIHHNTEYRVYAIGFAPGFAYLGDVDSRIATPRLSTPRLKVPRGAVAIADKQTAVYPAQSPGGWNIIGLCPTKMFDASREPTMAVKVGDRIKFTPINKKDFISLGGELFHE